MPAERGDACGEAGPVSVMSRVLMREGRERLGHGDTIALVRWADSR
jgi:hypothetical protein